MTQKVQTSAEMNEARWWSKWAEEKWFGTKTYVLTSQIFDEYFFNRVCLVGCDVDPVTLSYAESYLASLSHEQCVTLPSSCSSLKELVQERGYARIDEMFVLKSHSHAFQQNDRVRVFEARENDILDWTSVYLLSFYGSLSLLEPVQEIVREASQDRNTTLLIAEVGGSKAGVLALYRTARVLGVYCVGTLVGFRRRGVGTALLSKAHQIASSEGRHIFLQTLKSDGAERFYKVSGFKREYSKIIVSRKQDAEKTGRGRK